MLARPCFICGYGLGFNPSERYSTNGDNQSQRCESVRKILSPIRCHSRVRIAFVLRLGSYEDVTVSACRPSLDRSENLCPRPRPSNLPCFDPTSSLSVSSFSSFTSLIVISRCVSPLPGRAHLVPRNKIQVREILRPHHSSHSPHTSQRHPKLALSDFNQRPSNTTFSKSLTPQSLYHPTSTHATPSPPPRSRKTNVNSARKIS